LGRWVFRVIPNNTKERAMSKGNTDNLPYSNVLRRGIAVTTVDRRSNNSNRDTAIHVLK
jgi:hypothetical protein